MRLHDLTLPDPARNLAFDEALLALPGAGEALRLWEADRASVVLGRSSRRAEEVNLAACREREVPVLRRVSGGATIVTGPGCLMYAVVLDARRRPELLDLGAAHRFVLGRMVEALRPLTPTVVIAGTSDLVVDEAGVLKKFSGNSLRRVRDRLLYHGTLLYDFDLGLISTLLNTAPRQPEYRSSREHDAFVTNLAVDRDQLESAVQEAWGAHPAEADTELLNTTERLAKTKYRLAEWNESR
ncbi:putative lipoate-protein ligase A [Planctomycetes bacterium MalM25]|nr:putative lipoate-protein ligase A [Planctomycetes bacterium MalM25]